MKRRTILKGSIAAGAVVVAAGAGLLKPGRLLAAAWPEAAFQAESTDAAIQAYFGEGEVTESDAIEITAPLQAENGAVVPVKIRTSVANPEAIAILVDKNPVPFITSLEIMGAAGGLYSTRIKMGETSPVHGVVKAGGKILRASQEIKVTVGGCGG
jgi:sulfur-oxidizing protein SoxY